MMVRLGIGLFGLIALAAIPERTDYFAIQVIDDQTGRGVPLVELRTVHDVSYWTDSNGIVAFHEPGLMDQSVFFQVRSQGYEYPADGFGFHGKALLTRPGGSATLKIKRLNLAERLYRITGAGIYRDSVLTGKPVPLREPLLNTQVLGSDSVLSAVYQSRMYWFWGDTNRPGYPLGNFQTTGATSNLPGQGGLDPDLGVDLKYFADEKGFVRPMAPFPGDGPTWLGGLVVLRDNGERMFALTMKVRPPLTIYARGLAEWDASKQQFTPAASFKMDAPVYPGGHPFLRNDQGVDYVYFAEPYPLIRVRASAEALKDLAQYEAFTCLRQGSRLEQPVVERGADQRPVYGWKRNTPPLGFRETRKLIERSLLRPHEALVQLRDREKGKPVQAHGASVYWNEYRRRWVMIAVETLGTSHLGEVWYAEADTPVGPWCYAVKIVTHDRYDFYNPKQHPVFSKQGGKIIYFEGTYVNTFSGNPVATPRYNYNQMMYRLDLSDPRVALPIAVYRKHVDGKDGLTVGTESEAATLSDVAFFAWDRPLPGAVPIYEKLGHLSVGSALRGPGDPHPPALFYALPLDAPSAPATTVLLHEYSGRNGEGTSYFPEDVAVPTGLDRSKAICKVWRNPRNAPARDSSQP